MCMILVSADQFKNCVVRKGAQTRHCTEHLSRSNTQLSSPHWESSHFFEIWSHQPSPIPASCLASGPNSLLPTPKITIEGALLAENVVSGIDVHACRRVNATTVVLPSPAMWSCSLSRKDTSYPATTAVARPEIFYSSFVFPFRVSRRRLDLRSSITVCLSRSINWLHVRHPAPFQLSPKEGEGGFQP